MDINLSIDTGLVRKILTGFLRSEITRVGFSHAVVNLSGGIDSAVACALAAEALGSANVLAIRLPYKTSSVDSLEDAQQLIDQLGCPSRTIPITEMADALIAREPGMPDMRKGQHHGTLPHDRGLRPVRGLQGSRGGNGQQDRDPAGLHHALRRLSLRPQPDRRPVQDPGAPAGPGAGHPEAIIAKPPSADLWTGQTDEGELGFTYEDVDKLLYLLVDQRYRPEECIEAGFAEAFVRRVVERVRRNQFKRVLPPIAKLSNRTVGYDFLYLRDWGT